jgi:hypothetical protein
MKSRLPLMLLFVIAPSLCTAAGQCNSVAACLKEADNALAKGDNGTACKVLYHASTLISGTDNKALKDDVSRKAAQVCFARLDESLRSLGDSLKEKFSSLSSLFSGEPTNAEVTQAVVNFELGRLTQQGTQNPIAGVLSAAFLKAFDVRIISIEKLSCQSEGSRAFICYVEEVFSSKMTGTQKVVKKYRFLKNAEGWFVRDVLE